MQREARDKKLLALYREMVSLWRRDQALAYEKLDPPVQRGWKRTFVIRESIARSQDEPFLQKLLDKINTVQISSRKDFKKKGRYRGKKIYRDHPQHLQTFSPWHFEHWFNDREKKYFECLTVRTLGSNKVTHEFRFADPGLFVLRVTPNIISRVRILRPEIEKRADELTQHLQRAHLWPRIHWLLGDGGNRFYSRPRADRWCGSAFRNKPVSEILAHQEDAGQQVQFKTPENTGGFSFLDSFTRRSLPPSTHFRKAIASIRPLCDRNQAHKKVC